MLAPPRHRALVFLALAAAGAAPACGSSPSSPSGGVPVGPGLSIAGHRLTLMRNEIDLVWSSTGAPGYRLGVGRAPGASDVLSEELPGTRYTLVTPRTAETYYARVASTDGQGSRPSQELVFSTFDVRHLLDALVYRAGPMSLFQAVQLGTTPASVWPGGTHLRVLVSREAGERVRDVAQAAMDTYASFVGGSVTGEAELIDDDMHALTLAEVPPYTVAIRVVPGYCGASAGGCALYGPAPLGVNASIVTLASASVPARTVIHEMGHVYGMAHVYGQTMQLRFLMSPSDGSADWSTGERDAIVSAYVGGLRNGTTRDSALAAGLVLPWSPVTTSILSPPWARTAARDGPGALIVCR